MARQVGDLWPAASGSSSLGVDQTNCCPIGTEIRPFNHVHMNSGVWHDPSYGQSGVLRFSQRLDAFEVSIDGGLTFDLLPASGQIQESINVSADGAGTPHTQQAAYDGGNEIQTNLKGEAYQGLVVLEPPTPFNQSFGWDDSSDPQVGQTTFGIAVSGSPVPGSPLKASLSRLTSQYLHIRPSGAAGLPNGGAFIGFKNGDSESFAISASGGLIFDTEGSAAFFIDGQKQETIGSSWQVTSTGFQAFLSSANIAFQADTHLDLIGIADRLVLSSYATSGYLEYRFGPTEAWHTKVGAGNETLVPIPHSGHIVQMIQEQAPGILSLSANGGAADANDVTFSEGGGISIEVLADNEMEFVNTGTLQRAYNNGQTIFLAKTQDLQIAAANHKLKLGTDGARAEISMSGLLTIPSVDLETGDMSMLVHGVDTGHGSITVPTTLAESQALSLGIGKPMVNTGSGIVPVMVASGISSFFNVGTQTLGTTAVNVNFTANQVPDNHFIIDANNDIMLLVPGLYKATYAASCEKTAGTTRQQADSQLELNGNLIFGSLAHAYLRNNVTETKGTANGLALFDASAGDILSMPIVLTSSPGGNTVITENRAANVVLEYMGPKRGGVTVSP